MKKQHRLPNIGQVLAGNATCVDSLKTRIPQTAVEKAADNYPVGKQAADGGTLAQKLERINIKHAFIAGFESRQPGIDKLKEVLEQCAEVLNLLASRAGIQTEDAALKSDAEDYGALAALRAAREALKSTRP